MPGNQPCVEPPAPCDKNLNKPGIQPCVPDLVEGGAIPDIVLGGVIHPAEGVLGGRLPLQPPGAVLPITGPGAISSFLLAALGLMSAGLMILRGRRRK
jgi:LPXTG-motif cell wall-anchored protein